MTNAKSRADRAAQDQATAQGNEAERDAALANEAAPSTQVGGDDVATGTAGEAEKPKRRRKTFDEKVAEMRAQYESSERKRKERVLKQIREAEATLRKAKERVVTLTTERNDLRASIGLSPEDADLTEQGPDADEILANPEVAGDTTAAEVARS